MSVSSGKLLSTLAFKARDMKIKSIRGQNISRVLLINPIAYNNIVNY